MEFKGIEYLPQTQMFQSGPLPTSISDGVNL